MSSPDASEADERSRPTPSVLLGPSGPIASAITGFAPRLPQQEMADRIGALLAGDEPGSNLICEAGTGTGKTYAYLVPLLAAGRRAIISTATKPLQGQLVHDDIPRVTAALGVHPRVALLKGRANYLCRYRMERAGGDRRLKLEDEADLARIRAFAAVTESGDIAEVPDVPEQATVWPLVTSTTDNCLGGSCPRYDGCFAVEARKRALEAEIVVANHHLLVSDLTLKAEGFGELLPEADVVVIDEAHALVEVVRRTLGFSIASRQVKDLAKEARAALKEEGGDATVLDEDLARLADALDGLDRSVGMGDQAVAVLPIEQIAKRDDTKALLATIKVHLGRVAELLSQRRDEGPHTQNAAKRFADLAARQAQWAKLDDDALIRWAERSRTGLTLRATPHNIADAFGERRALLPSPWVFTSATLAVSGGFEHFTGTLGLGSAETAQWDSPFDFARRTMLYLPKTNLMPANPGYLKFVADTADAVVRLVGGRTFVLFTSHHALREVAAQLRRRLPWPLLVQGDAPREQLIARFIESGEAVLCGTASFWEGVDVRGPALSAVVIDKLPFPRPDDPIRAARAAVLKQEGRDPFSADQLPSAVLTLKQGVGRLIRDVNDSGIVALCDPRLTSRGYGKAFLRSLPPMPTTHRFDEVEAFWKIMEQEQGA